MIGTQPTGLIDGVVITAVSHEGLRAFVNGKPAQLAIIADDGTIVASGRVVAREALNVSVNCYRNVLKGQGFLRVISDPLAGANTEGERAC